MIIVLLIPHRPEFLDLFEAVRTASGGTRFKTVETANTILTPSYIEELNSDADLIIADTSSENPDIYFELGIALALGKPTIIITNKLEILPSKLVLLRQIVYDRNRLKSTLTEPLKSLLESLGSDKSIKQADEKFQEQKALLKTVFVSYSHIDLEYMSRLEIHLKPFEKLGQIEIWSDKKIKVGDKWKETIEASLARAAIAILLISADFLASDFVNENELPPLLKSAEERGTLILSIIVKPCRFAHYEHLSKFQAVNDPRTPLSKMDENDREEVYVKVAEYIDNSLKA